MCAFPNVSFFALIHNVSILLFLCVCACVFPNKYAHFALIFLYVFPNKYAHFALIFLYVFPNKYAHLL